MFSRTFLNGLSFSIPLTLLFFALPASAQTPTETPSPASTETPTVTATPTPLIGCDEFHIAQVGVLVYPLSGCPGHRVEIAYSFWNGPINSLRIQGYFGAAPYLPPVPHLGFYWKFATDTPQPVFQANIEFQYNLADLPPGMNVNQVNTLFGYDASQGTWYSLAPTAQFNHTATLWNATRFYDLYAIGYDPLQPTPTLTPTSTPTPIVGCNESHTAQVGVVVYSLPGCPGHQVVLTYHSYSGAFRSLRIKAIFGNAPNLAILHREFYWDFTHDPSFGAFVATIKFFYNGPGPNDAFYGYNRATNSWNRLPAVIGGSTVILNGVTDFYDIYVLGEISSIPTESPSPLPTETPTPTPCTTEINVCGAPVVVTCTPTPTPSQTPTRTPAPTRSPTATAPPLYTPSFTPTAVSTATPTPSSVPTPTPTDTPPPTPASVWIGGYMLTFLQQGSDGTLQLVGYVPACMASVIELASNGTGTGVFLYDDGSNGDSASGDCLYTLTVPLSGSALNFTGRFMLEIIPGTGGLPGNLWPYLTVNAP